MSSISKSIRVLIFNGLEELILYFEVLLQSCFEPRRQYFFLKVTSSHIYSKMLVGLLTQFRPVRICEGINCQFAKYTLILCCPNAKKYRLSSNMNLISRLCASKHCKHLALLQKYPPQVWLKSLSLFVTSTFSDLHKM